MPDSTSLVHLALLIRRGQLSINNIPDADRSQVWALAQALTDAQCGVLASSQESKRRFLGRKPIFQTASS